MGRFDTRTNGGPVDFNQFLNDVRRSPDYAGQAVYVREDSGSEAQYAETLRPLSQPVLEMLHGRGIERLYSHQAEAIDAVRDGENVLVVTGTASGKSLCYLVPIIETLLADPDARMLLLFPTKALCQDQYGNFTQQLAAAGVSDILAGVFDGDTTSAMRRKLRDHASVIFSNPDMVHASMMSQHSRWAGFMAGLKLLVIDELHVYSGIFGSNFAGLMKRFHRACRHYGSAPQIISCSATIGNPGELAEGLTGKPFTLVNTDSSPRGHRTYVFWNPPRIRERTWRSRRSANDEAHELMAMLVQRGVPTITFSKAKVTAEMIYRYVCEKLKKEAPQLIKKLTPYRGGYRPKERREIEKRLFDGELIGVSTTRALELGIDVGGLDASIIVGYPGTLASFFQQSGRAGRRNRDALVVLVGLDTSINQYVMSHPEYIFGRPIEQAVIDPDNPFVITGHLRCATHELALADDEVGTFGPHAGLVLRVLQDNLKVQHIEGRWYHAATETPQHETSLRDYVDKNVMIEDVDTGEVIGQVNKLDAPPILHPEAIYLHQGDTYRVLELDLEDKFIARVKKVDVDYYTQPLGGTDIHHVDHRLREKPFGTGMAYWGEVTAYFGTNMYEKIRFYELDAISQHPVELPTFMLETMAVWLVPPDDLMELVRCAGLDVHSGLRGIGYATRMLLPLFMTCDTLDFSHSIGSVNSEWNAIFIYERYQLGLGFTAKAYELLHEIMPRVLDNIRECSCSEGCPCCVGKPLRQYATWNVERGEASIPSKPSALMILENMLGDFSDLNNPDRHSMVDSEADDELRLEMAVRRRLERMREPQHLFHPIEPRTPTEYPDREQDAELPEPDVTRRGERRRDFHRELDKRIAKHIKDDKLAPLDREGGPPAGMKTSRSNLRPTDFAGKPPAQDEQQQEADDEQPEPKESLRKRLKGLTSAAKVDVPPDKEPEPDASPSPEPQKTIQMGDSIAAKARKLKKRKGR